MEDYTQRVIDNELDELLEELPALMIEGPKWVGKTETALKRAKTVHRLDKPEKRQLIQADSEQLITGEEPILIDEWQRVPKSWDAIKRAVDDETKPGRFLLTGSAIPNERSTHSGAGRIVKLSLRPFSLFERNLTDDTISMKKLLSGDRLTIKGQSSVDLTTYVNEIVKSGFPELRIASKKARRTQLQGYLDRVVDSDFEQLGHTVRKPETLKRWMTAYAAAASTTASYEQIRDAATSNQDNKPAKQTTQVYREKLEQLYLIDSIPAWKPASNEFKRLIGKNKHQLCDPALAVQLLGMGTDVLLDGQRPEIDAEYSGRWLGRLFESLLAQSVKVYAQVADAQVRHLRTKNGRHEVDLIVQRRDKKVLALEVKLSNEVTSGDTKHLRWLKDKIGDRLVDAVVINTGEYAYRRDDDNIAVIPAALLGP